MDNLIKAYVLIENLKDLTNIMDYTTFSSFFCVLAEEWCKANSKDVVEYISTIANQVKMVNAELGAY